MKKFLTKMGVVALALFTLVSCSRTSRHNVAFEYANLTELETVLSDASFYGDKQSTGVYAFDVNEDDKLSLVPTECTYKLYSAVDKADKKTMTKDDVKLTIDHFVVESSLLFKPNEKAGTTYRLSFRNAYDTDILGEAIAQGKKIEAIKANKLYREYEHTYTLNVVDQIDGEYKYLPIVYICSDVDEFSLQQFTLKLKDNIKYIKVGK